MPLDDAAILSTIPLPIAATTRDGFEFDPRPDLWRISSLQARAGVYDFSGIPLLATSIDFLKLTVLDILEKQSVSHARNMWGQFCAFYRAILSVGGTKLAIIDIADLMNYRAALRPPTDWKLGSVRVLLKRATALGYPVATPEALDYLCDAVISDKTRQELMFGHATLDAARSRPANWRVSARP